MGGAGLAFSRRLWYALAHDPCARKLLNRVSAIPTAEGVAAHGEASLAGSSARTVAKRRQVTRTEPGHGRIDTRTILVWPVLPGIGFPHAQRAARVTRVTVHPMARSICAPGRTVTETTTRETAYLVTNLCPDEADLEDLLALVRPPLVHRSNAPHRRRACSGRREHDSHRARAGQRHHADPLGDRPPPAPPRLPDGAGWPALLGHPSARAHRADRVSGGRPPIGSPAGRVPPVRRRLAVARPPVRPRLVRGPIPGIGGSHAPPRRVHPRRPPRQWVNPGTPAVSLSDQPAPRPRQWGGGDMVSAEVPAPREV